MLMSKMTKKYVTQAMNSTVSVDLPADWRSWQQFFVVESVLGVVFNGIFILTVLLNRALREKTLYLMLCGQSFADVIPPVHARGAKR